jgi:hypothetical protein
MQMLEHPLPMRDFAGTQPPGIPAVQAGWMRFQHIPAVRTRPAE